MEVSCEDGVMRTAGIGGRTRKVEVKASDSASVEAESGSCIVRDCKDSFCFKSLGAVARDEEVAVAEDAVEVTKGMAKETGIQNRLNESGDGELAGLHSGFARNV